MLIIVFVFSELARALIGLLPILFSIESSLLGTKFAQYK